MKYENSKLASQIEVKGLENETMAMTIRDIKSEGEERKCGSVVPAYLTAMSCSGFVEESLDKRRISTISETYPGNDVEMSGFSKQRVPESANSF